MLDCVETILILSDYDDVFNVNIINREIEKKMGELAEREWEIKDVEMLYLDTSLLIMFKCVRV